MEGNRQLLLTSIGFKELYIILAGIFLIELLYGRINLLLDNHIYMPSLRFITALLGSRFSDNTYYWHAITSIIHTGSIRVFQLIFIIVYIKKILRIGYRDIGLSFSRWKGDVTAGIKISLYMGIGLISISLFYYLIKDSNLLMLFALEGISIYLKDLLFCTLYAIVSSVIAPIVEEIIFRGLLYNMIRKRFSIVLSVLISASIFAGAHLIHIKYPIAQFFGGLVFAVLIERYKSLIVPIIVHCIANTSTIFFTLIF